MPAKAELKLLLVEDHAALRDIMSESLRDQGYRVAAFESAEAALQSPDIDSTIALLDVNLPGEDGMRLAYKLRILNPGIGIILMTVRNRLTDKVEGYEAGADLYLPKPVAPEELNAAIQALCRRLPDTDHSDLVFHYASQQLSNHRQEHVILSTEDARLLAALYQAPGARLEYWEIAEQLGLDLDSETLRTTLEKRVSRLRRKLTQLGQPATAVKALRGYGYEITCSLKIH